MDHVKGLIRLSAQLDASGRHASAEKIDAMVRRLAYQPWQDDDEFRRIVEDFGSEDDINSHLLYTALYGDKFPDGDGKIELEEHARVIALHIQANKEFHGEFMIGEAEGTLGPEEKVQKRALESEIAELEVQLQKVYQKLRTA